MARFRVTYEIVTEESAEHGETAEHGFMLPGEWRDPMPAAMKTADIDLQMDLRSALRLFVGHCCEDSGSWFTECDDRHDYIAGHWERRSLHPPRNITQASYDRVRRLIQSGRYY